MKQEGLDRVPVFMALVKSQIARQSRFNVKKSTQKDWSKSIVCIVYI